MSPMVTSSEKKFEQYEGKFSEKTDCGILVIVLFGDIDSGIFYFGSNVIC